MSVLSDSKKSAQAPVAPKTSQPKAKRASIAGTDVELYVDAAFANKIVNKDGSEKHMVGLSSVKRRDVDPKAPYAGSFVVQQEFTDSKTGKQRVGHTQPITVANFNKLLELNGQKPLTDDQFKAGLDSHEPLVSATDSIAFKTTVFSDKNKAHHGPNGSWTHLVNQSKFAKTDVPFDFTANEKPLIDAARKRKAAAKSKATPAAAKAKAAPTAPQADEPEI